jgi:TP901 family phage tail tape measure protein
MQESAAAEKSRTQGMARERYALYDVAAAYQEMAQVAVGALTAVIGTAAEYERAFANVIRTTEFLSAKTGESARVMKVELMDLASEIPVAFGQITEIATIGNQLGIAQADLSNFTETVAKFASTTDVTVSNAALSFGRIGELLNVSDFNALGSAIAFAGVNAVATETQILAVTKEISTTAKQAKFTAPEVIGLATALSSLGIAPEAARGSIIRSFAAINKAISEGGEQLDAYSALAGMSAQQFASTWQTSGSTAFDALLQGLQKSSDEGNNLDTTLRGLGIRNVRDIQTLQKLGDNYGVYAQSIQDSNKAYEEGTFLSEAYGVIQDTVASKIAILQNQIQNLMVTLGEESAGPVKILLDIISAVIEQLTDLARNPAVQFVAAFAAGITALVAGIAALNAVVALTKASMLAFGTAMGVAGVSATGAAVGVGTFATAASAALLVTARFTAILVAFAVAVAGIAYVGDQIQRVVAPMDFARRKAEDMIGSFNGLQEALSQDYAAAMEELGSETAIAGAIASGALTGMSAYANETSEEFQDLRDVQEGYATLLDSDVAPGIDDVTESLVAQNVVLGDNFKQWVATAIQQEGSFDALARNKDLITILDQIGFSLEGATQAAADGTGVINYIRDLGNSTDNLDFGQLLNLGAQLAAANLGGGQLFDFANTLEGIISESRLLGALLGKAGADGADGFSEAGDEAEELEESIKGVSRALRTVVDYANDLNGILSRVVELEFGKQITTDSITTGWRGLAKAASEAEDAIAEANNEIKGLTADRSILEYQLSVAERYGDEVRAAKLRAEIAKINDNVADSEEKIAEAEEKSSTALEGNSDAAIRNRASLLGMVSEYQSYIEMLAKLGNKQPELEKQSENMKKEFLAQAEALGYSSDELSEYANIFDQFAEVASDAPRDVDIEVNLGLTAAEQAITEFIAKKRDTTVGVNADTKPADDEAKALQDKLSAIGVYVDVTPAEKELIKFTSKERELGKITADTFEKKLADDKIKTWLNQTRVISASLEVKINKTLLQNQANAFLNLMRASTVNSVSYKTYQDMYLIMNRLANSIPTYADGGFVQGPGTGTSDSIPAMLSNGEFVMKASAVKTYGVDFFNSLNQQRMGFSSAAVSSSRQQDGPSMVFLSPEDRQLLRQFGDRPVNLYADSTMIAQVANEGNTKMSRRGSY